MNKVKISVIIPVYNGEKHIESCIKSLQNQTLKEIEFIFVNDGSLDNSLALLKTYKYDSRIKIFSQENKGVSAARNLGIKNAIGEYIGFLDVDDEHKEDMYDTLFSVANNENLDVVVSNILLERDNKLILKKSEFENIIAYSKDQIQNCIIPFILCIEDPTLLSVCNKIYKREIISTFEISFDEQMKLEEDTLFNLLVFNRSNNIKFLTYAGYIHKDNPESVTRDIFTHKVFENVIKKFHLNYKQYLDINISDEELYQFQCSRLIYTVNILIFKSITTKSFDAKTRREFLENVIKNNEVKSAVNFLHPNYLKRLGRFEKIIIYAIKKQNVNLVLLFSSILNKIYSPKLSEFIRKFNK